MSRHAAIGGAVTVAALAMVLSGCGGAGSGSSGGGSSSTGPMAAKPPDLSTLAGGKDPLTPLSRKTQPADTCKILTDAMVLALIPGAGSDGVVSIPNRNTQPDGSTPTCQYAAATKDGDGQGNVIIDFITADGTAPKINRQVFKDDQDYAKTQDNYRDFGSSLGAGSTAYFNGASRRLNVLYHGQPFSVSASGSNTEGAAIAHWRDNVDAPVAANIIARMNG